MIIAKGLHQSMKWKVAERRKIFFSSILHQPVIKFAYQRNGSSFRKANEFKITLTYNE